MTDLIIDNDPVTYDVLCTYRRPIQSMDTKKRDNLFNQLSVIQDLAKAMASGSVALDAQVDAVLRPEEPVPAPSAQILFGITHRLFWGDTLGFDARGRTLLEQLEAAGEALVR